ncbi:6-phosphogluconate dehydrogenase, putative [Theileria equi strain WA]|uniref:6-phosphogluconate dehydrogenase, decarboxylating n=1 Tax=Theileria equi strain WA TaxID=1537102 RepID=L0AXZ0_THEEQ|nr:6-phosphogluconate dehydrogenase, putative [Theileria equi strain WA]AFZ80410.1 6-phosphogluconate dehydrogenase, putative [Theileria equi strain WA]|eukprot:XP_004830076.1 6-phosphogluconate dehydrogenase, putative [Theileria equi strain WA]
MELCNEVGLVGLGVMASAYARNLYFRKVNISAWSRSSDEIAAFERKLDQEKPRSSSSEFGSVKCFESLEDFVASLASPRKILILITAGSPVDSMLDKLIPLLQEGDIVVDGGNEWYLNTKQRIERCKGFGIRFCGMGVSGGEQGARNHPCLMFGGEMEDYLQLFPIMSQDGKDFYVGTGASGHYVKMVHNGIEYAILQAIAEVYKVLKLVNGSENDEIAKLLGDWNRTEFKSYLLDITEMILQEKDNGDYIVDKITPSISSNGTGKWTVQDSFDRGIPVPSIGMSVDMRSFSNLLDLDVYKIDSDGQKVDPENLRAAFRASLVSIFSQGIQLLTEASKEFDWGLEIDKVADVWSRNSIISCELLNAISEKYQRGSTNLLQVAELLKIVDENLAPWKKVVTDCINYNVTLPVITTSLQYVQVLLSKQHCHNLIQAQRDCFGSHGFNRVDLPGKHHHDWWRNRKQ